MRTQESSVLTLSTTQGRALWISTLAFTVCFAVWTIFAIIGIRFVLPIAFGFINQATGLWTSCFMLLFVIVMALLVWMHLSIRSMEKNASNATVSNEALERMGGQA